MAILVKTELDLIYDVSVCCCDSVGILGLAFMHKQTKEMMVVISNYLPPAGSRYGGDPEGFFNKLILLSFKFSEGETLIYCGDFNARIGGRVDCRELSIPDRQHVDPTVNSHGGCLLDFINDVQLCIVNGRTGVDKVTCETIQGSSVVDYMLIPYDCWDKVRSFKVTKIMDIISEKNLGWLTGPGSSPPDHNLLTLELEATVEHFVCGLGVKSHRSNNLKYRVPRKFRLEYMNNTRIWGAILDHIEYLEYIESNQTDIDSYYEKLCELIKTEMKEFSKVRKRKFTPFKEYWNPKLTELWRLMKECYAKA